MKIGTRTFNSKGEIVTITDMQFIRENIEYMNVLTKRHFNVFANGILTSNRFSNMYKIKNMKYIKTNKPKVENTLGIDEEIWKEMRLDEIVGTAYKIEEIGPHIADLQRLSKKR